MRTSRTFVILMFMAVAALVMSFSVAAADSPAAFLPGLTSTDAHAKGCVDCHVNAGADKDYRVNKEVAKIKGHPDISKVVKNVPGDCKMCHKAGAKAPVLEVALHTVHYGPDPAKNVFVTAYSGACLNCHKLDLKTGIMSVKSGPANW